MAALRTRPVRLEVPARTPFGFFRKVADQGGVWIGGGEAATTTKTMM